MWEWDRVDWNWTTFKNETDWIHSCMVYLYQQTIYGSQYLLTALLLEIPYTCWQTIVSLWTTFILFGIQLLDWSRQKEWYICEHIAHMVFLGNSNVIVLCICIVFEVRKAIKFFLSLLMSILWYQIEDFFHCKCEDN